MEAGERGAGGRAGSSADSLAEEEDEEDEEVPGSGRSSRTSSLVSGLLTELYSAAEVAAPPRVLRELQQQRPSRAEYLRLKGTGRSPLRSVQRSARGSLRPGLRDGAGSPAAGGTGVIRCCSFPPSSVKAGRVFKLS